MKTTHTLHATAEDTAILIHDTNLLDLFAMPEMY